MSKGFKIIFSTSLFIFLASNAMAVDVENRVSFYLEKNFDVEERQNVVAVLVKSTSHLNIYIEEPWWSSQSLSSQNEALWKLDELAAEFSQKIYPTLTQLYGSEAKPGIDSDNRITVLFHQMKDGPRGYFRSNDGYLKLQVPDSNEREMVYLNIFKIKDPLLKTFLAHEFSHVIQFNQKNLQDVFEEAWLNEARAEYAITALGYNNKYEGSNLQNRVRDFLANPSDSLTEWRDSKYDYGVINLFIHYLVNHYGINILTDSLKLRSAGIKSINEVFLKRGVEDDFGQIFTDWTIASIINNCSVGPKYCYLTPGLKDVRVNPPINFLPLSGNNSLIVTNFTKNWSGNWQKIIGGGGNLNIEFSGSKNFSFKMPYVLVDKNGKYEVEFLALDKSQTGKIQVDEFSKKFSSIIILPSLQLESGGLNGLEPTYQYSFTASVFSPGSDDKAKIQQLLAQIDFFRKQITALQGNSSQGILCNAISSNLYLGISDSSEVRCLQQFLKNQGQDIYPEGLVTGYFGPLTQQSVIRFQEKYRAEILLPLSLNQGTGFVGILTRTKINQILNG